MEAFFQADFSNVRVHEGPTAHAMGALAFTLGENLHFAPGLYNPASSEGLALLGHELAHVVQQREGRVVNPYGQGVAIVQDPALEAEADAMALQLAEQVRPGLGASRPQQPHCALGNASTQDRHTPAHQSHLPGANVQQSSPISRPRLRATGSTAKSRLEQQAAGLPSQAGARRMLAQPKTDVSSLLPRRVPLLKSIQPGLHQDVLQAMSTPLCFTNGSIISELDIIGQEDQKAKTYLAAVAKRIYEGRDGRNYACVCNEQFDETNLDKQATAASDIQYAKDDEDRHDSDNKTDGHAERMAIKQWINNNTLVSGYHQDPSIYGRKCHNKIPSQRLYVFTEREPCDSCKLWLNEFAQEAKICLYVYHVSGLDSNESKDSLQMGFYFQAIGI